MRTSRTGASLPYKIPSRIGLKRRITSSTSTATALDSTSTLPLSSTSTLSSISTNLIFDYSKEYAREVDANIKVLRLPQALLPLFRDLHHSVSHDNLEEILAILPSYGEHKFVLQEGRALALIKLFITLHRGYFFACPDNTMHSWALESKAITPVTREDNIMGFPSTFAPPSPFNWVEAMRNGLQGSPMAPASLILV